MGLGAALLGLVFLMEQKIWALRESALQPSIWAVPGPVISIDSDVSIYCWTPPGMDTVRVFHSEPGGRFLDNTPEGTQEVSEFHLQKMSHTDAGVYTCLYSQGGVWSQIKDKLELVVTGVYKEKPSLTVDSGPKGFSERNVTLLCHTNSYFDTFILCRGGNASFPQNCSSQSHHTFLIFPVSPGHRRIYRCFGSSKHNPYMWSLPSDPLELSIPGKPDHTVVWVSVAAVCFLLLFVLLICLYCYWAKCRATNDETRNQLKYKRSRPAVEMEEKLKFGGLEGSQPEDCKKEVDTQVSPAEDSQGVTYAQLRQENFTASMDLLPSKALLGTSTQTCVYASLTLSQEKSQS
ncbi:leukocyte immunoglobulin-like receptor subfamily B member 3 isoform X1 [Phodopus roborovskii]|uniref:leukocyte immunoglobulin-like receptor subfamily B member 3 isoform X1 n=1 Tax=Phodopus roborovskii TaxID=109678 RepID=UPI0021E4F2E3|nr:leukocyte immunoglobulin-like receptor subfamily B member 3 isoform X1 [Phodopus roborovskii]